MQKGAGAGLSRCHHPPSVLQTKEWRPQPLPLLPQNRDVPAHGGSALPGDSLEMEKVFHFCCVGASEGWNSVIGITPTPDYKKGYAM